MTGKTHVAIGLAGVLALTTTGYAPPDVLSWGAVVVGSLAPDIDSGGGTIARPGSLFERLLPRWIVALADGVGLTISRLIRKALGHRTATHWPAWGVLMVMGGIGLDWPPLIWFGAGYLLHILGDFCTVSGVPLFGPFWLRDIKWSPIKTDTWPEYAISTVLWLFIGSTAFYYMPPGAQNWLWKFGGDLLSMVR